MDLFEHQEQNAADNAPVFTVSELSGAVKRVVEDSFGNVRVRGELGRVSRPASGHLYMDLKDDKAVLNGVMWKGVASQLPFRPEEGIEVIAYGKMTTFPGQSRYQLVISRMEIAGEGALMALLDKRKKQLAAEGLFAAERKRPLPYLPTKIGVITSRSGAVIRDILHRLSDRFPREVLLWPVTVQGTQCAPEVTRAIEGFNRLPTSDPLRPDVIIVARGGGSIEDLWGFNEESVARAVAASQIPIISAIGHETDVTLIDYVADKRAPTPTAAAELAVPVREDLQLYLSNTTRRMKLMVTNGLNSRREREKQLALRLPKPEQVLFEKAQRLDRASERLKFGLERYIQRKRDGFLRTRGAHLSPERLSAITIRARNLLTQTETALETNAIRVIERKRRLFLQNGGGRTGTQHLQNLSRIAKDRLARQEVRLTRNMRAIMSRKSDQYTQQAARYSRISILPARQNALAQLTRNLQTLSYEATLERGYAVIRDETGGVITNTRAMDAAGKAEIQFKDGRVAVKTRQT